MMNSPESQYPSQQSNPPQLEQKASQPPLSPDEMRVLKECMNESFYYRCIPFGFTIGGTVGILVNKGMLTKHPRWGAFPKIAFGSFLGYVLGKWSYAPACRDKLMRLPNSPLADAIRKQRGMPMRNDQYSVESGYGSSEVPNADSNLQDTGLPADNDFEGMDSYDQVTQTLAPYTQSEEDQPLDMRKQGSYDDLRKQNRDEYSAKNSNSRFWKPPSDSLQGSGDHGYRPREPQEPLVPKKRNKYGDVWEE